MNTAVSDYGRTVVPSAPSLLDRFAKALVLRLLSGLRFGRLLLVDGDRRLSFGNEEHPCASITVRDPAFYRQVLLGGSIGGGEAYVARHWEVDDLTSLVRIMVKNMSILDRMEQGLAFLLRPFRLAGHLLRRNSRQGARRNILAHYDLGNEMYRTFLDPSMMYSAAIYPDPTSTLEEAARFKLDLICKKLGLAAGDRVIEIGSGWGGFAMHAARHYGCHVTTTTISEAQYREAARRIAEAGLTDRITLLRKDYRDLTGSYDKLVSIEMIEAVGDRYLPTFFKKCGELLKRDGAMLLQAITIRDQKYQQYRHSVDFIQRHIFPGGHIPSVSRMAGLLASQTDMVITHLEDFAEDYARTLADWRRRFARAQARLEELGYDDRFRRLWEFYFCYCEGGFLERSIGVMHLVAARPDHRQAVRLP